MVSLLSLLWIFFVSVTDGHSGSLEDIPSKLSNVNSGKLLGTWYRFAHYIPCSWNGARKFSDGVSKILLDKNDPHVLKVVNTWRSNGECAERIEKISRGCIENNTVKSFNSLGGMGSGLRARVAIDYDEYDIIYGCAKVSFDNPLKCDDPSLSVLLRHRKPRRRTALKINYLLGRLFGINLRNLVIQNHSGDVCPSSCCH